MTTVQFKAACDLAMNHPEVGLLNSEDYSIFSGYGIRGFKPVFCTIRQVAALIRYQCGYICGGYDMQELNELARAARRLFNIIDS